MSNHSTYVVIMAGGLGTRFWPSSRQDKPKQFLDILGLGKSLLRLTFERFLNLVPARQILVLTHEDYRDLVAKDLPELASEQILAEPSRRNTAPCIAYAALKIGAREPKACFVVAPSDHLILKEAVFLDKIRQGLAFVGANAALLTLGIQPHRPNTGYGYIQCGAAVALGSDLCRVASFREKPDLPTAEAFLAQGNYLWNAGIFLWSVEAILAAFQTHAPEVLAAFEAGQSKFWTSEETSFIAEAYPKTPCISIDYAIMEKAQNIYTLPADIGWSDLGTWASLYEQLPKDAQGNAGNYPQQQLLTASQNCLVQMPQDKLLIAKGLDNYIIVDDGGVLLIYPKDQEQEIKQVQQQVQEVFEGKYT